MSEEVETGGAVGLRGARWRWPRNAESLLGKVSTGGRRSRPSAHGAVRRGTARPPAARRWRRPGPTCCDRRRQPSCPATRGPSYAPLVAAPVPAAGWHLAPVADGRQRAMTAAARTSPCWRRPHPSPGRGLQGKPCAGSSPRCGQPRASAVSSWPSTAPTRSKSPEVAAFRAWAEAQLTRIPGKGDLAEALRYGRHHFPFTCERLRGATGATLTTHASRTGASPSTTIRPSVQ